MPASKHMAPRERSFPRIIPPARPEQNPRPRLHRLERYLQTRGASLELIPPLFQMRSRIPKRSIGPTFQTRTSECSLLGSTSFLPVIWAWQRPPHPCPRRVRKLRPRRLIDTRHPSLLAGLVPGQAKTLPSTLQTEQPQPTLTEAPFAEIYLPQCPSKDLYVPLWRRL
jgi:hypothetical protein